MPLPVTNRQLSRASRPLPLAADSVGWYVAMTTPVVVIRFTWSASGKLDLEVHSQTLAHASESVSRRAVGSKDRAACRAYCGLLEPDEGTRLPGRIGVRWCGRRIGAGVRRCAFRRSLRRRR
jgi:hypothetical protein